MRLQRTIGNQAFQQLPYVDAQGLEVGSDTSATTRFAHDFSRIPVHSKAPAKLQAKLTVNTQEDIYEQEADRLSEQVPSMPEPKLQRACACGDVCSKCQNEEAGREHLRTKQVHANRGEKVAPPVVHEVLRSSGQPLDPDTRALMEPWFRHDFSRVRVHADAQAARAAAEIGARAWTFRHNIAFGSDMYAPSTPRGAALLAHELAHVVQQQGLTRSPAALEIGEAEEAYEHEADAHLAAVAAGGTPRPLVSLSSPRIQRSLLSGFLDVLLFVPRLFGLSFFPIEDLQNYLADLKKRKGPEGGLFSDNKARACVERESELGPYDTQTKIWLVEDMLMGWTSFRDEGAIINLFRRSADIQQIVSAVGRERLWSNFSGQNRRIIEAMTLNAADAGDALVARLRKLDLSEIQDYAVNASDPAVRESARRAAALARMTAPVPTEATITPAGEANFIINGVRVIVQQDRINPSVGIHAFTYANFIWAGPGQITITPENANLHMGEVEPVDVNVTIWTEFSSEEAKSGKSGYGVGTRSQDQPTLRYHESAHGQAWLTFLRNNPPPVFRGARGMLPAEFNAAVQQWNTAMRDYLRRAQEYSIKMTDCVGTLPTNEQLAGTGFTAAICH
jgi:hypothetical protein